MHCLIHKLFVVNDRDHKQLAVECLELVTVDQTPFLSQLHLLLDEFGLVFHEEFKVLDCFVGLCTFNLTEKVLNANLGYTAN